MSHPPLRTSTSRYIRRAIQSTPAPLNLSRLPRLPEGTPPLLSRRTTPGDLEFTAPTWGPDRKTVDDDFFQAVRLEALAEKKLGPKSGKQLSQRAMQFPFVQLPYLDIRMIPKKLLVVKEQERPPILSKNPRKERSDLSLLVVTSKASVHKFAVVRVRVRRRIISTLDLIVRRGVYLFPESEPGRLSQRRKPDAKRREPDPQGPRILLHDPTLADPRAWFLPDWAYTVFVRVEILKMPLPDLVDQMRLGLRQANQKARIWQDQYMSTDTGEFIPLLSKGFKKPGPPPEPKSSEPSKFGDDAGRQS